MATAQDRLLDFLRDYQDRNRLNNEQMAERLGVPPSTWSLYRRGKRSIPRNGILASFVKLFPRRMGTVRDFLLDAPGCVAGDSTEDDAA